MRLFVRRFLLVSLVFILIIPPFIYLSYKLFPSPFLPNINYKKNSFGLLGAKLAEADTTKKVDVLVLGSSHAYRSVNPLFFDEIDVLNLGSSAQTPIQSYYLLNEYIAQIQPKVILWEVFPGLLSSNGIESSIDFYSNFETSLNRNKLQLFLNSEGKNLLLLTYFVNFFENIFNPIDAKIENDEEFYLEGGYVQKKQYKNNHGLENRTGEFIFPPRQLNTLKDGIELIQDISPDTKIFLFQAPISGYYYSEMTNMLDFDSLFYIIAKSDENIFYVNYNELKQKSYVDTVDFYDAVHMTSKGSEKFTSEIKNDIDMILSN